MSNLHQVVVLCLVVRAESQVEKDKNWQRAQKHLGKGQSGKINHKLIAYDRKRDRASCQV